MASVQCVYASSVVNNKLRIGQLNANGSKDVLDEVKKSTEELQLDILCLQEPYSRNGKIPSFPITAKIISFGKQPMAAIIVLDKEITATVITQVTDEWTVCVEIGTNIGKYILVSMYFQHRHEIQPYLIKVRQICNMFTEDKIIICADSNAKSTLWDSPRTDDRGEEMEAILMELNLEVMNQPGNPPTYRGWAGGESYIDVTLTNQNASQDVLNWKVEDGITSSDHNVAWFTIGGERIETTQQNELRYNINKTNWIKLEGLLRFPEITEGCDVNLAAQDLTKTIQQAIRKSTPQYKKRKWENNSFWNAKLERLRRIARARRKSYQRSVDANVRAVRLELYRTAKKNYEEELKNAKLESWERYVNEALTLDPWGTPYKIVMKKIKEPQILCTLTRNDGTKTTSWRESIELLMEELLPDDKPEDDEIYHQELRRKESEACNMVNNAEFFSEEEVRKTLLSMATKKAPGPDGIKTEVLQKIQHKLIPYLTQLFNECLRQGKFPREWKMSTLVILKKGEDKSPEIPKSYRPICLINSMGKLFEKVLIERLTAHRTQRGINECQYGFRKGKSTEDAINKFTTVINENNSKYKLAVFVDISGAFDNLWWPTLFNQLKIIECPRNIYHVFQDYCKERLVSMKCPGDVISKRTSKGCPQGSVCGPVFWDVALEPCLSQLESMEETEEIIAYADDIVIIINGNSRREIERKTNTTLSVLETWCRLNKLKLSKEKTVYMLMGGNLQRNPTIKIDNNNIQRVKVFKYLGLMIDEKLNFHHHIKYVSGKAVRLMNKIISIGQRRFRLPLQIIKRYHDSIMVAMMSYGASVWGHRLNVRQNAAIINRAQRIVLIRLCGAYSTTPQDGLLVATGVHPMHLSVIKRASQYWIRKENVIRASEILRTLVFTREEVGNILLNRWQEEWNNSTTGRRVYQLLPDVRERLRLTHLVPSRGMLHFITGHGPYRDKLYKLSLTDTPMCYCGEGIGSPEHDIWECRLPENVEEKRNSINTRNVYAIIRTEEEYKKLDELAHRISIYHRQEYQRRRHQNQ